TLAAPNAASQENLKCFQLHAIYSCQRTFEPHVTDMVLPARIRATRDAYADWLVELHLPFEFAGKFGPTVLGFGESELTKLCPGTSKHALSGPGRLIVESS